MKRRPVYQRVDDATFELNLAPMLDMLVVLITVLLVSFTTVKLGLLDGLIPQPVAAAMEKDKNKKDRTFSVSVKINANKTLDLMVREDGKKDQTIAIAPKDGKYDFIRFHKQVVQLKMDHTDVFRMELNPTEDISYEEIIQVMDRVRVTDSSDPAIYIMDEKTKQKVKTNLLFPDVVFANAVES